MAGLVTPVDLTRQYMLPIAWVWHILLLSPIGNREVRDNVRQLAFSLAAQWIAGFILTLSMGSGTALKFILSGHPAGLATFLSGALFIPDLALGVWSGTSKPFEVVYVTLWYLGPLNNTPAWTASVPKQTDGPSFIFPCRWPCLPSPSLAGPDSCEIDIPVQDPPAVWLHFRGPGLEYIQGEFRYG